MAAQGGTQFPRPHHLPLGCSTEPWRGTGCSNRELGSRACPPELSWGGEQRKQQALPPHGPLCQICSRSAGIRQSPGQDILGPAKQRRRRPSVSLSSPDGRRPCPLGSQSAWPSGSNWLASLHGGAPLCLQHSSCDGAGRPGGPLQEGGGSGAASPVREGGGEATGTHPPVHTLPCWL